MNGADDPGGAGSHNLPAVRSVGFRRPPAEHRFKKGQSGNPRGRPPGSRIAKAEPLDPGHLPTSRMILEEAYRPVSIREGDEVFEIPAIQAVMRAMGVSAIKGNRLAQKTLADIVQRTEAAERAERTETLESFMTYKSKWDEDIARCQRLGLAAPTPLPHPDDVLLDFRKGTVKIAGPTTKEEQANYDLRIARRDEAANEVAYYARRHRMARKDDNRDLWMTEWHFEQRIFDLINDSLPDRYKTKLENRSYRECASRAGETLKEFVEDRKRPKSKRQWS
jgi:hypothetical protein